MNISLICFFIKVFGICCVRGVPQPPVTPEEADKPKEDDNASVATRADCQLDNARFIWLKTLQVFSGMWFSRRRFSKFIIPEKNIG